MINPTQPQGPAQSPAMISPSNHQQANAPAGGMQAEKANLANIASAKSRTATTNGQYDPNAEAVLKKHLSSLPPPQKQFISQYLCPETLTLMGIIVGAEVYDFLKPFTDPSKMAIIVPRNSDAQAGQAPSPQMPQNSSPNAQQPQQAPAQGQSSGQQPPAPQAGPTQ